MRQKLFMIIFCCVCVVSKAQYVTIPDSSFRIFLKSLYPNCFNAQDKMDTTCSFIISAQHLSRGNDTTGYKVKNLDGVQYFKNLQSLYWYDGLLEAIPKLPPFLHSLEVRRNKVTALPPLNNGLYRLLCENNQLTILPNLPSSLEVLLCDSNHITTLPTLPPALKYLYCESNELTTLPSLPSLLETLKCGGNRLIQLPLLPASVTELNVQNNKISLSWFSSIQLPYKLINLYCAGDSLTSLPAIPSSVRRIFCSNNRIQTIVNLPDSLLYLEANKNPLSQLSLPKLLQSMDVYQTNLICLPYLPKPLWWLHIDSTKIQCLPNKPAANIYHGSSYDIVRDIRICNPTNNINNCQSFPSVYGRIYTDLNNNGAKDNNETYRKSVKVSLSNGNFTYTNDSGFYEIATDTLGSFQMTITSPSFFSAVPNNILFQFTTYDTSVVKSIALQRTVIKDSLAVSIIPMLWRARPGFNYPYRIEYRNAGSTDIASAQVVFQYDNTRLNFDSVSNASAIHSGNTITVSLSNLVYGSSGFFNAYFKVKTTVPLGDTLIANATITSGTITGADNHSTIISGAFDPNDKNATPILTPSQVSDGSYIYYTIRFQNTGTDTAFNVVVTDTLSSLLDVNSLQLLSTSHLCNTIAEDNKIAFEFRNILLPDSNVNEPASHGFIYFRVKAKNTVVVGNTINNKAAIYFDYNSPVITNTTATQIQNPQVLGLKLISLTATLLNNDIALQWITQSEINTTWFEVEQSTNGRNFSSIGRVASIGYGNNRYAFTSVKPNADVVYFRLKMVDKDGSYSYSAIVTIHLSKGKGILSVYPNPVQSKATVTYSFGSRASTNRSIELHDVVGKKLRNYSAVETGSFEIDTQSLSKGVYMLVMKEDGLVVQTLRLVKQ